MSAESWKCSACTFANEDIKANVCMICETPRLGIVSKSDSFGQDDLLKERKDKDLPDEYSESISDLNFLALPKPKTSTKLNSDSISKLCHMSFGAWEEDRQSWVCKLCTFENGPRFLVCGACGVRENATNIVEKDEAISSGLQRMCLRDSQQLLTNTLNDELANHGETKVKKEHSEEGADLINDSDKEATLTRNLSSI